MNVKLLRHRKLRTIKTKLKTKEQVLFSISKFEKMIAWAQHVSNM